MLEPIREGLVARALNDGQWTYDHIGSTAVPDLQAKPFIDLQLGAVPTATATKISTMPTILTAHQWMITRRGHVEPV
jgi:GrpB-like predicted nucleotidyltransferase (UPF0157 family)